MIFIFRLITLDKTVMILADYQAEAERKLLEIFGPIGIPYSAKRNPILPIDPQIILKDTSLIDSTFYVGMPVMVNGKHVILKNKNC